jgi:single-strand DNA-binding protein
MTIIGRVTKDAVVHELKDDRKVVNFSIAVNDYYKPKGQEKATTITTYFKCSYWVTPKAVERLKKGALVEFNGRVGVDAYIDMQGNAKAQRQSKE